MVSMIRSPARTPVLPSWFDIQTYAGRPLNTPVPPRTWVDWSLRTSQFRPTLGDQRIFGSGRRPVSYLTGLPFSSRNVRLSAPSFRNAVFLNCDRSNRKPAVTVTLRVGRHSSCAYPAPYHTFTFCRGFDRLGMLIQRTWNRESTIGDVVRFAFARKPFASA